MKFGVKTFDNPSFLKHFESKADFFEIMAVEKNNYGFLNEFKSKPMVIHSQHINFGINIADPALHQKNLSSIKFAQALADQTKAKYIILHPGDITNPSCALQTAIDFVRSLKDKRIIIENMPADKHTIGITPKDMSGFLKATKSDFCFDINHAISAALSLNKDPYEFIKEFIKLKPSHYHLGGQKILPNNKDITHLSFKDSNIDLDKILSLIPSNAEITLETSIDINNTDYDLKTVKELTLSA